MQSVARNAFSSPIPDPSRFFGVAVAGACRFAAATNGQAITFDNIADAVALLEAVNVPVDRMALVLHPRNIGTLRKVKASTAGTYLWSDAAPAADAPRRIFGVRSHLGAALYNESQGSSGAVCNSGYLFDRQSVVYVRRQDLAIVLDRSWLFNSDQSELRATMRGDLIAPTPSGIVRHGLHELIMARKKSAQDPDHGHAVRPDPQDEVVHVRPKGVVIYMDKAYASTLQVAARPRPDRGRVRRGRAAAAGRLEDLGQFSAGRVPQGAPADLVSPPGPGAPGSGIPRSSPGPAHHLVRQTAVSRCRLSGLLPAATIV